MFGRNVISYPLLLTIAQHSQCVSLPLTMGDDVRFIRFLKALHPKGVRDKEEAHRRATNRRLNR